ncbi:MAG: hypothetical protein JSR78_09740, partial [Proteobacteria bacterium]|nr:hypothetical protein [Pseudomonadota bacterium]
MRLLVLGALVISMALMGLAHSMLGPFSPLYRPGTGSTYGGMLLAIITFRIGYPKLLADWIALGGLYAALGLLVAKSPLLTVGTQFTLFSVLLTASAVLTIWLGATHSFGANGQDGFSHYALVAAGIAGLLCVAWAITSH